jgi:hypothetical protein
MSYAFEFTGGARNGTRVSSGDPIPQERKLAEFFWTVTNSAAVGTEFVALSDAVQDAGPEHVYRVMERVEELGGVLARCTSAADPPATLLSPELPQSTA